MVSVARPVQLSSRAMNRALTIFGIMLVAVGCESRSPQPIQDTAGADPGTTTIDARPAPNAIVDAAPPEPTCDERRLEARSQIEAAVSRHRSCHWDVDCVLLELTSRCAAFCPVVVPSSGVIPVRTAFAEIEGSVCEAAVRAGCTTQPAECAENRALCVAGSCTAQPAAEPMAERAAVAVPPQNSRRLSEAPTRPEVGDAEERARRLFAAIVHDDPQRAMDFFFPREAFLELKGIADSGRYWDRLMGRYVRDVHDLHENTPDLDQAEFVRLDIVRRGGWVAVREEGNRLPYWASRHAAIYYRVGEEERRMEVRVLITWGERWYIIHLSEFR